jgi:putative superfamily III holin-X
MHPSPEDATTTLDDLRQETAALVRTEVGVARAELRQKIADAVADARAAAAGGAMVFAGVLLLLWAAVLGLGRLVESLPLAAFVTGAVVTGLGTVFLAAGRRSPSAPDRTLTIRRQARVFRDRAPARIVRS